MSDESQSGLDAVERGPEPTDPGSAMDAAAPDAREGAHATLAPLRDRFGDAVGRHEVQAGDEHVVFVEAGSLRDVMAWLKDDPEQRYDLLRDVTAVDYGGGRPIQVVYQLWSIPNRRALRVKCELPLSSLEVPSVTPLWKTADWLEREVYDMFGVDFEGHPDLRRILMPENYAEGHPLRKDFPLRGRFTRAEQTRRALSQDPKDHYIPAEMEIGREAQMAEGAPEGRQELPDASEDTPGGVEAST